MVPSLSMNKICCHTHVNQFVGKITLDFQPHTMLHARGHFHGAQPSQPIEVAVELPQHRHIPSWLRMCAWLAGVKADWDQPSVVVPSLSCFNFGTWTLCLPFACVDLQSLCGYLPVHIVVRQPHCEWIRIVVQRMRYCTHFQHPDPPTLFMQEYDGDMANEISVTA